MSGLKKTTKKNLMVFQGRAHPELAEEVAAQLGTELVPTSAYEFANSEIYVRYEESVRGCDAFVIQSHTAPINEWIMEHLIMVDALKRASAKRITVVHAVLRLRPPGQEAPRPRADLGPADGRPVQDRRRRPADLRRPARRPDPGLLRRSGRPPDGAADPRRLRPGEVRRPAAGRGLARRRPDQGRRALVGRLGGAPLAFIHKTRRDGPAQRDRRQPGRRRRRRPHLRAGRRHDRHRRHDREGRRGADGRRRRRRRSSPRPTRCSPTRPSTG